MIALCRRILGRTERGPGADAASTTATATTRRCRLLELPAELRDQIYWYVAQRHLSEDLWNNPPGLLRVCHAGVRAEFADVWYGRVMAAEYYDRGAGAWTAAPDGVVRLVLDSQQDSGARIWIDGSYGTACAGVFGARLRPREECRAMAHAEALFGADWLNAYPKSYVAHVVLVLHGAGGAEGRNCALAQIRADYLSSADQTRLRAWFVANKLV